MMLLGSQLIQPAVSPPHGVLALFGRSQAIKVLRKQLLHCLPAGISSQHGLLLLLRQYQVSWSMLLLLRS
jgi:hypothetical protein